MKTMLIIGRFQPFHSGHLAIIKKYHKKGFFIKIVIGSSQRAHLKNDPFTKDERIAMIDAALRSHEIEFYQIIFTPDVPDDSKWVEIIKKKTWPVDVLFTGNPWVKRLFRKEDVELHEYDERFDRIKSIKAKDIRLNLINSKSSKGLPRVVFNHLKIIGAFDRLKEMHDSKKKVHYLLNTNKLTISSAESCTGGAISRALISYSGASKFFRGAVVAYSVDVKQKILGVLPSTISKFGVVSVEVAAEMARGALNLFETDYAIASTGFADPSDEAAGNICLAVMNKTECVSKQFKFKLKDRNKLIDKATREAIKLLYELLKKDLLLK
ncbi:MAG: nicotinamide-nucleotide amidohydrolase family protein [Candidatus Woesearchaeota archaeon]